MLNRRNLIYLAIAVCVGLAASYMLASQNSASNSIIVPKLTALAKLGKTAFNQNCATCHGKNAAGTQNGPPLVHIIYEPNHHTDASFYRAAQRGVRAHHWRFGNMPPLPHVRQDEMAKIISYIRELQRANGIF